VELPEQTPLVPQDDPQVAPAGRPITIESVGTGLTVAHLPSETGISRTTA